jgi:hypothetical protein
VAIRQQITNEIMKLGSDGPDQQEMEKLRNTLCNDAVRGRQSTMFRAQRIAEHTIYDDDPTLFDHELDYYLQVTADQIREVTAKYLNTENRVVLDIIPAAASEAAAPSEPSTQPVTAEPPQPGSPAPQIPAPAAPDEVLAVAAAPDQPDSEPVHPQI